MYRFIAVVVTVLTLALAFSPAFCAEADFPQDKIIAIATAAAQTEGIDFKAAEVIYDEDGKLWSEKVGYLAGEDKSPNHGILRKGFLKNYRVVYFDFKEPLTDVWIFVDKDSGEVLDIYRE